MSLQYVDIGQVYLIHQLIIKRAGAKAGIRDFTLLHSAVERPKATFQGKDLYPDIFSKAAALLQSLCLNHPFTDGNKRTAWTATHKFLWDNGYHLRSKKEEATKFVIWVDNSKPELPKISSWLKKHSEKINQGI
ncbi:MAG: Death-on-curing family protein [Candidatus Woesebacteria bacterium GW2011_GWB1_39_12]|uniref:Death-on-curing family protein n=2 Tax=Candidatus Woeseibacteriota TaxID=1752722 RepID=A0A0G0Q935_9BACT|nr:MAG: Death-on-curing family protein [Candidatus Woesebacteria bacterium GW2011_GWA1_39_12]KKR00265.1 MAG: Death-on-curing family protein [Candidatus Woesebacteria bacterium GW2011_GWB1_39_12]